VDESRVPPDVRGGLDEGLYIVALGHVSGRDAHLVAGVREHFCGRLDVGSTQVGQQYLLADTDPSAMARPI